MRGSKVLLRPLLQKSGKTAPHGFNWVMLKIIIDYDINKIQFRHLLIEYIYYQYGITVSIPDPDNVTPVRTALSDFLRQITVSGNGRERRTDHSHISCYHKKL
jgi:hypothetical protein